MLRTFNESGINFQYPENWELEETSGDGETTLTLRPADDTGESPTFWSVLMLHDQCEPTEAMDVIADAFVEEYGEADFEDVETVIAGRPAIGQNIGFFCLELTNTAYLRSFNTNRFTMVLLAQCTDTELTHYRPIMEAMTASLQCEV